MACDGLLDADGLRLSTPPHVLPLLCSHVLALYVQVEPLLLAAPKKTRFVLVTATIPQHVTDQLLECFPGMQAAFGPGLHRTASGLLEELIDCSGGEEISLESGTRRKLEALDKVRGAGAGEGEGVHDESVDITH